MSWPTVSPANMSALASTPGLWPALELGDSLNLHEQQDKTCLRRQVLVLSEHHAKNGLTSQQTRTKVCKSRKTAMGANRVTKASLLNQTKPPTAPTPTAIKHLYPHAPTTTHLHHQLTVLLPSATHIPTLISTTTHPTHNHHHPHTYPHTQPNPPAHSQLTATTTSPHSTPQQHSCLQKPMMSSFF